MSTTTMFIMRLENGKYFVDCSKDPEKAMQEHIEGLGPLWTRIHRPLEIIKRIPFQRAEELDVYVKSAMRTYGLECVRGGTYSNARLKDSDRHALHSEFYSGDECNIA
jgi:predicted GIY-YIG superfamily endonuclease